MANSPILFTSSFAAAASKLLGGAIMKVRGSLWHAGGGILILCMYQPHPAFVGDVSDLLPFLLRSRRSLALVLRSVCSPCTPCTLFAFFLRSSTSHTLPRARRLSSRSTTRGTSVTSSTSASRRRSTALSSEMSSPTTSSRSQEDSTSRASP